MADPHTPDWVGPALAAGGTAFAGLLGWLGLRAQAKAPKADPQAAINTGFNELLTQMRQELIAASRERNALQAALHEERTAWAAEREAMRGEIAQLRAVAEGFERLLRRNGIAIPERKTPAVQAEVVGVTLRQEGLGDED